MPYYHSGPPSSLKSRIELLESERLKAEVFLKQTVFPKKIRKLVSQGGYKSGLVSYLDVWEDIAKESAVLDLYWNLEHIYFRQDEEGARDVYTACGVSIEMTPTGLMIFRGGFEASRSVITPNEWRKNPQLQDRAFRKIAANPKEGILYEVSVSQNPTAVC